MRSEAWSGAHPADAPAGAQRALGKRGAAPGIPDLRDLASLTGSCGSPGSPRASGLQGSGMRWQQLSAPSAPESARVGFG